MNSAVADRWDAVLFAPTAEMPPDRLFFPGDLAGRFPVHQEEADELAGSVLGQQVDIGRDDVENAGIAARGLAVAEQDDGAVGRQLHGAVGHGLGDHVGQRAGEAGRPGQGGKKRR